MSGRMKRMTGSVVARELRSLSAQTNCLRSLIFGGEPADRKADVGKSQLLAGCGRPLGQPHRPRAVAQGARPDRPV